MGISFNDLCIDLQEKAADYGDTLPLEDWPIVFNLDGARYHLRRWSGRVHFDKEAKEVVVNIDN
jgi:hypothetical protein